MAIPLSGSAGDLFNRFGKQIGGLNEASSAQSTANARAATIFAQFQSTDQAIVANLSSALSTTLSTNTALFTEETNEIPATLVQMAIDDSPGINPQTLNVALAKLIFQMNAAAQTIVQPTLTRSVIASAYTLAITGATNATPIVITANGHGLSTGARVSITGVLGNTAANGTWTITKVDANTFDLNTSVGNGAYTSSTGTIQIADSTNNVSAVNGNANIGTGVVVCSLIDAEDGTQTDYALGENILIAVTADGYPGGSATAGSEPLQFTGQIAVVPTAWNWPQGSGASVSITTTNAAATGGLITDGSFEVWSGVTPALSDWTKVTGTWGTSLVQATGGSVYSGTYALEFVGTAGGEHTEIQQATGTLAPLTVYAFNAFMKQDGSVVAGVLQFRLLNANGDTQLVDAAGNNCLVSVTCANLTTDYAPISGFFRTPAIMPSSGVLFDIYASTALTNAHIVYLDMLQIVEATQLYDGGPYSAAFAGNVNFKTGDTFTLEITTTGTTSFFTTSLNRTLGLAALGPAYKIPSLASGATISNSLIS